jgi:ribosomal-protein-alanine N-acetyltransferase
MYYLPEIRTEGMGRSRENLVGAIKEIENPNRKKYFFRIEDRYTGTHIGEIGYTVTGYSKTGKTVNAGYFICKEFWGKGYTTEALRRVLQYAFMKGGVGLVETGCLKENIGSERVMQKCGMRKEERYCPKVWHDGVLKERLEYRLTREEWMKNEAYRVLPC